MNPIRHIRRLAGILAAGVFALLALAAASPALAATASLPHYGPPASGATPAFARVPYYHPGAPAAPVPTPAPVRTVTHTLVLGGMPGWQIALIATGAALLAAALAVLADRALAARRRTAATA